MNAVFHIEGQRIVTGPDAAGPWDPSMQHGSAPSALVTFIAEAVPSAAPMQVVRVGVDLMRPVPVAPLTFETQVIREGRKIQLVGVTLLAGGKPVVEGRVLRIVVSTPDLPEGVEGPPQPWRAIEDSPVVPHRGRNPFLSCLDMKSGYGDFATPGPGAIWFRVNREIVAGAPVSQAMRAVIASDLSNGVSSPLDFRKYTFLNADLTVSFSRLPEGEWILVDSESWLGHDGAGLAAAKLADRRGYFGRSVQSLVVEKRAGA
jgi:hypothetical protein